MNTITSWEELAEHLGPAVYAAKPVEALRQSGFELDPALAAAVGSGFERGALSPEARLAAAILVGPTPPVRIRVGSAPPTPHGPALSQVSGFDLTATANLTILEAFLGAWWEARIYPQDIGPSTAARLIDVATLSNFCVGVPPNATIAALLLPAPPTVQGATHDTLSVQQAMRLQLTSGGQPVELVATARILLPVQLGVGGLHIYVDNSPIAQKTSVSLAVDPASAIRPSSPANLAALEQAISTKLGKALGLLAQLNWWLPATYQLPGVLSNSHVIVEAASAWLLPDRTVLGSLIAPDPIEEARTPPPPNPLADQSLPATPPDDIRAVLSEQAIENFIKAGIASGDIAARINATFTGTLDPVPAPTVVVDDAHVTINSGTINVELDCRVLEVCLFDSDLGFVASVHLRPSVIGEKLYLKSDGIDLDLENVDVIVCIAENALLGRLASIVTIVSMTVAGLITIDFNKDKDAFLQGKLLKGTEVHPRLDLHQVATTPGLVHGSGSFSLVHDDALVFVYLQVVQLDPSTGIVTELEGVRVDLLELDQPAPPGDDFQPPPNVSDTFIRKHTRVRHTERYTPLPDSVLGSAITERHGLARFAIQPNDTAGVVETTDVDSDVETGEVEFESLSYEAVGPDMPDLAVTITLRDGTQPVVRQLIALNLNRATTHLGTLQDPLRVVIVQP
jgi:hypothetical protein